MSFKEYVQNYQSLSILNDQCFLRKKQPTCNATHGNLRKKNQQLDEIHNSTKPSPFISIDASVTYLDHTVFWQDDPLNNGSDEMEVFTPHRIHHFVPHAKAIAILRNPVERLISDFYFFIEGSSKLNPDLLHTLVENGINWWENCTAVLPESKCAFGVNFKDYGLPNLPQGFFSWGELTGDGNNGAARLRMGIYSNYLERWFKVFGRENILVIQMEQYSKNIAHTLTQEVLPFLELDPFLERELAELNKHQKQLPKNVSKKKDQKKVYDRTRQMLENFYRPYNQRLATLLNDKVYLW